MAARFRKKPVVIEAELFDGSMASADSIEKWSGGITSANVLDDLTTLVIDIPTLEGTMRAVAGDFIIRGVQGEFYPCKPDIFHATYEYVE
jgi:hypothetical protein